MNKRTKPIIIINVVFLLFILVFSIVFSYKNELFQTRLTLIDSEFKAKTDALILLEKNNIIKDWSITVGNEAANTPPSTSAPDDGTEEVVVFSNFQQMFKHAVQKYNNAKYTYSSVAGTITLNGTAKFGAVIQINNAKLNMTMQKLKRPNATRMDFRLTGVLHPDIKPANIYTVHYSNGSIFKYTHPINREILELPVSSYKTLFDWDGSQIFHLPTEKIAQTLKETEYAFIPTEDGYQGIVTITRSDFGSNYASVLKNMINMKKAPEFTSIQMTINIDKSGNFKNIIFMETIRGEMEYQGIEVKAEFTTRYVEEFIIIDNGVFNIVSPF